MYVHFIHFSGIKKWFQTEYIPLVITLLNAVAFILSSREWGGDERRNVTKPLHLSTPASPKPPPLPAGCDLWPLEQMGRECLYSCDFKFTKIQRTSRFLKDLKDFLICLCTTLYTKYTPAKIKKIINNHNNNVAETLPCLAIAS